MWSSIVDDFLLFDATPDEIVEFWTERDREQNKEKVKQVCGALGRGKKPYFQFTMTWDEAVKESRERHGADAAVDHVELDPVTP